MNFSNCITNLAGEKKGDILEKITFFVLSDFFLNLLFSHIQIFQLSPFFMQVLGFSIFGIINSTEKASQRQGKSP